MKTLSFLLAAATILVIADAIAFDCTFNSGGLGTYGTLYTCKYPTLSNLTESKYLTTVTGTHASGKTNADVQWLHINYQQNLTFFPKSIAKFFPNLIAMWFSHTGLASLDGDELNGLKNLMYINIEFNPKLERIPGNLFTFNPKLNGILFSRNNIKHVSSYLFNTIDMSKLKYLYFNFNSCVNQQATNQTQIASLIDFMKINCTDIEVSCDVCKVDQQNQILSAKIDEMRSVLNEVLEKINQL